jgi:predicted GIY-YIG superfamily endonuclease
MSYHIHADKRTYVYRIFDESGKLIYVGCSHDPEARIYTHRMKSWWAPQISRIKLNVFPNRQVAIEAEAKAIRAENPRWNINHRSYGQSHWNEQTYIDFIKAMELAESFKTPYRLARIEKAKRYLEAVSSWPS